MVRTDRDFIEAPARQKMGHPPQSQQGVPQADLDAGQLLPSRLARRAVDGRTHGLAPVVLHDGCTHRLVVAQTPSAAVGIPSRNLRERANPVAHLVEDLRLDVAPDRLFRRCRGDPPGDVDGPSAPDDAPRRRYSGGAIGQAEALFGGSPVGRLTAQMRRSPAIEVRLQRGDRRRSISILEGIEVVIHADIHRRQLPLPAHAIGAPEQYQGCVLLMIQACRRAVDANMADIEAALVNLARQGVVAVERRRAEDAVAVPVASPCATTITPSFAAPIRRPDAGASYTRSRMMSPCALNRDTSNLPWES